MDDLELGRKIEEKITVCEEKCEKDKKDSFLSIVRGSELETLQALYKRFQEGTLTEKSGTELEARLLELEEAKAKEDVHPSFDWYDEHYHYKVLAGQCSAYRSVIELLRMETGD